MKKSKDEFVDLREALQSIVRNQGVWRDLLEQISTSIEGTKQAKTIGEFINVVPKENSDWQKFQFGVSDQAVYSDDKLVERILQSMSKKAFSAISQKEGGTQFKFICRRIFIIHTTQQPSSHTVSGLCPFHQPRLKHSPDCQP